MTSFYSGALFATELKKAKKSAAMMIFAHFFTYCGGCLLMAFFCACLYYVLRLFSTFFAYLGAELDFFVCAIFVFVCISSLIGFFDFVNCFKTKKQRNYALIFMVQIRRQLLAICIILLLLCPFSVLAHLPPHFADAGKGVVIFFESLSFAALFVGICAALSYLINKNISAENIKISISFWVHYLISLFSGGIYLIFVLPYMYLTFSCFKERVSYVKQ